ncbi:glycosyltransferase [Caproiciproducens faecalis]|uniref:Glycosyltransferase n=1 Tax=Caproiciproducens faecalis TaxID=2820301 RepID=A0ABS7DQY0_9FIRM|nr:glycosyltransferase [Caproiciproducens faecalis]MBW7573593.1 glycosyltransferase [Caproiciproducens faecalis]
MKNCLVFLTKTFPFDKGEEFIEDELPLLANAFDQVIIVATSTADVPVQTRDVPENVCVHHICASKVKHSLAGAVARQFPFKDYKGYSGKDERAAVKGSLKKKLYLSYFIAKSEIVYDETVKILAPYSLQQYDGVTFYSYWFYDIAMAAVRLKRYCQAKVKLAVCRAHGYDLYAYRNSMNYLPLRNYLLKNIDKVYTCSQNGKDYLTGLYPQHADKIQVSYLGTRDYGTTEADENGPFHIASCCHIVPLKRVDMLAKALNKLNGSGLQLKWTHFGGGDALEDLKKYAAENLQFMECDFQGEIKNSDLMTYYQNHPVDLFVNTSSTEGLPVSVMEACSFGIPTIATDVGGTGEIVCDGKTGFLIEADFTPGRLADAIRSVAEMPWEEKQKLRENCRSVYLSTFCAQDNFAAFANQIKPI